MDAFLTEEQQLERIKRLWDRYGNALSTCVLLGACAIGGWNWWQQHTAALSQSASKVYELMLSAANKEDMQSVIASAKNLKETYPSTAYAQFAALKLAQLDMMKQDTKGARTELNWVRSNHGYPELAELASLRLATVELSESHPDEALTLLKDIKNSPYQAFVDEALGDVYLTKKMTANAKQAYEDGVALLKETDPHRVILSMKLANVGAV